MSTGRAKRSFLGGVAESELGEVWDQSELDMAAEASARALAETGVPADRVDTVYALGLGVAGPLKLARSLGCSPGLVGSTDIGGASFGMFVDEARAAIESGRSEVTLIAYASRQRTRRSRNAQFDVVDPVKDLAGLFGAVGLPSPIGDHALLADRYFHHYGAGPDDLAAVAIAAREWAILNDKAWLREPLTPEAVAESPIVSSPLRKVDCCLVTDGGGAVLVVSESVARESDLPPVAVLGTGVGLGGWSLTESWDTEGRGGQRSARTALAMAGIGAEDIDVLEPYDNFTISVLMQLEDLGICGEGEAASFVSNVGIGPGGGLPAMTSGGGLAYCHPGKLGLLLIVEAARQLRGQAGERQVDGSTIAAAHSVGGTSSAIASTVVLART